MTPPFQGLVGDSHAYNLFRRRRHHGHTLVGQTDSPRSIAKLNTHISYAEDGSAVEVVILEARANGAYPLEIQHARAA